MTTPATPPPLWKILSFILPLTLFGIVPVLLFMRHPGYMTICTSICSFFIVFFFLNLIIPDNQSLSCQCRLAPSQNDGNTSMHRNDNIRIFFLILFAESSIFLISRNFSFFAFNLTAHTQNSIINLPVWLGLWSYFSAIITTQHYAHYHLRQVSSTSGLLFLFKNTYLDITIRRILGGFSLGLNLIGIYFLIMTMIFITVEHFQPKILQHFHITSFLFFGFFLYLNLCFQSKKIKKIFNKIAFSNVFYLCVSSLCYIAVMWASFALSQYCSQINIFHNISFSLEKSPSSLINPAPILFTAMFILLTPIFASLIVKHTAYINRKILLLTSFCLPNIFYLSLTKDGFFILNQVLNNKILFIAIVIIFLIFFFREKTTSNFITGMLPIPKQCAILPAHSYLLFPAHCLILFNFYLLFIIIGPVSLYAIAVTASLLSAALGVTGVCSYFGKTYRRLP